jgi:flagellar basal-body rod protein FlgG
MRAPLGRIGIGLTLSCCVAIAGCNTTPARHGDAIEPQPLGRTGRPLDLAVRGEGYFIVQVPSGGFLFTRRGGLNLASTGDLVNEDGYKIYPFVTVAETATLVVAADGSIHQRAADGRDERIGQILLARFERDAALDRDGVYRIPTAASGDPITGRPGTKGLGALVIGQLSE